MIDTILSFIPSIPGNIIIFFPSYGYLNDCYSTWDRDGKLALLFELKKVYKEEAGMSNDSFNSLVQQYEKAQYPSREKKTINLFDLKTFVKYLL